MYDELIFVSFSEESGASETWIAIEEIHEGRLFRLVDILLIIRDKTGSVTFQPQWKEFSASGDQDHRIPLFMAESLFGASAQLGIQQLSEAGLDKTFLQDVAQALKSGTSALLVYVPGDSLIDARTYLGYLSKLQGKPYHTTFPSAVKETILQQGWHTK